MRRAENLTIDCSDALIFSQNSQLNHIRLRLVLLASSGTSHLNRHPHPVVDALQQEIDDFIALLLGREWAGLLQGMVNLQLIVQITVAVGPVWSREVRLGEVVLSPLEPSEITLLDHSIIIDRLIGHQ